jgi:hypothetical protein
MKFYIYICRRWWTNPIRDSPCENIYPSKLTEAVDDPLFKSLKLAAPGPDFNVQTPEPIVGVLPPRGVLIKCNYPGPDLLLCTVGFSFKLTEILAFVTRNQCICRNNHWIRVFYIIIDCSASIIRRTAKFWT